MAQQQHTPIVNNPKSLYEQCLPCYITNLKYNVAALDSVQQLRYLPQGVLIDIYAMMSQREEMKDILLEQLSDLQIFERLLRFDPARQKLFGCLASLMSSNKPLASQLQKNFTMRYRHELEIMKTATALLTYAMDKIRGESANNTAQNEEPIAAAIIDNANVDPNVASTSKAIGSIADTPAVTYDAAAADTTAAAAAVTPAAAPAVADTIAETTTQVTEQQPIQNEAEVDTSAIDVVAAADAIAMTDVINPNYGFESLTFGLRLGTFLSEAGWLSESIKVLFAVAVKLRTIEQNSETLLVRLDCLQRLLHSEAALCNFKSAQRTFNELANLLKDVATQQSIPNSLLANTYTQFSAMYFARSEYDDSHMWSVVAMRHLEESTPERIAIDVLRQAAKACVVKRDFQRANMLICQAIRRARKYFGVKHQKYGDTLLDYGFFLLNVDSVFQSVNVYKEALEVKRNIFGNRNFHVAVVHEDLSYAFYVHEYSTGNFTCAREHVEKAVDIMKDLVPSDHLMLASTKRVKALLLEEIALDKMADGVDEEGLLKQSEELHKFALHLSLEVFGEVNVQTAKHYGNLGRLYQTMNRFEEAERMHQKAIKIKTDLLGPFDYEVGLSIGHLASLYNYQMKKYREAEDLYLRSIEISLRLFGRSYSGLEYDYLGLCHVYETLRDFEKYLKYATILENWQVLRGQNLTMNKSIYPAINEDCTLEELKYRFFNMSTPDLKACNRE